MVTGVDVHALSLKRTRYIQTLVRTAPPVSGSRNVEIVGNAVMSSTSSQPRSAVFGMKY